MADGGGVKDEVLSSAGEVASGVLGGWSSSLGSSAFPGAVVPVVAEGRGVSTSELVKGCEHGTGQMGGWEKKGLAQV